ncbi:MAG TPA: 8-amino-7-oxononanoate synthase [Deltaproteobacteria bacterium]|nr:8-amino-7-oxononanoate synthase [Deltaproteobacteria bacterium]
MKNRLASMLKEIRGQGNYRSIRYVRPLCAATIIHGGKEYLNLCSNSYLSLHLHPAVMEAARSAVGNYGTGTCSSRSVSGSIDLYEKLEAAVARYKGYKKGLIFPTGYMANIGIVSTIPGKGDVIFSDELNHSSLIDAMRLSYAKKVIYRHRDAGDLERKLKRYGARGKSFVITESIFSMDGDMAPLAEIMELRDRYGFYAIVDDAHGTGIFGKGGSGVEEHWRLKGAADIHMATFGKAMGSFGAFVLSDPVVIEYLVNRARTFMYTTALPPAALAASQEALDLVSGDLSFKEELWRNIDYMRSGLLGAGFDLKESTGPIVPIVVGKDADAVKMQKILMNEGFFLQAIRPPTVPTGTSRLRLTVVRGFSQEQMDRAIEAITAAGRKMKLV